MDNPGYSLADIRAATDHDNYDGGWGGNGGWFWIVVLFLLCGRGGFGWGGNESGALTRSDLCEGFNFQNIENGIRGIQNGICDGFYAQNTTLLQGLNGLGMQVAENRFADQQCCCETNRNIDSVRAENYRNTCEITNAIRCEGEQTRALINSNTMQNLRDRLEAKNQELQTANFQLSQQAQTANLVNQLRPCPIPAYLSCSPYTAYPYNGCGCNSGCCNG